MRSVLDAHLEAARREVQDPEFRALRAWKEAAPGRACVGFFPVYAPQEVIHAAGALPVAIYGGGDAIEVEQADARMQSFICSISRSTLELGLSGRLGFLDGMLFSSLCDVARNLSGVWQRNFPGMFCEYLHYPQNLHSAGAAEYYRNHLRDLAERIASRTGRSVTEESLVRSLDLYEEQRRLLRRLAAVRREEPWRLSLEELLVLVRAAGLRDPAEHNAVLEEVLQELPRREGKPLDGVRVVLEGSFCEQPPLELLRTLDDAHCFVVESDLARGLRWYRGPLQRSGDPWEDLVRGWFEDAEPCVARHKDPAERSARLVERVRESGADGVLFCIAKFCEPAFYDFVLHKRALEAAGIPYLEVEFEEKMATFDSLRTQAETFVESILFFAEELRA